MATINSITAEARDRAGKGAARATRRAGRVPAVIYGKGVTPVNISLDPVELRRHLTKPGFFSHVCDVKVNGSKSSHRVLPRDVQYDPVTDRPIHVDFFQFNKDTKLTVEVEVTFINADKSPGLKAGGVLNVVRHEIELFCSPDNIPEGITVDLAGLEIGDSIHISAVKLPADVKPTIARDFTVATIAAPSLTPSEEDEKAAAAAAAAAAAGPAEGEAAPGEAAAAEGGDDKKADAKAPAAKAPAAKK
jgi:large subunit ribosomal protein L25